MEIIMKKYGQDNLQKKVKNKLKRIFFRGGYCLASVYITNVEFLTVKSNTSFFAADSHGRAA
ncbi:MAG: hypothetical protein LUG24_07205 [Clostridiales bacterium]|nr:hypothetical protein [Clostridiales bacterium]